MTGDYQRALAKSRAGPGVTPGGSAGTTTAQAAVRLLALPVADVAALLAAADISGASSNARGRLLCALYIAAVLVVLAAGRLHQLRICLRVSDEVGRILIATTMPVLVLLAWLPATRVLWLALWSGGLVVMGRAVLCTALRAAHRRGLLTEPAVVVGAGHSALMSPS